MLPDDLDALFLALGHRDRRLLLDVVRNNPGCCVDDLLAHFQTSRVAVLKHIRCLERADLILSKKVGRHRRLYFNVVPIQFIYERWATEFSAFWASGLTALKYRVESEASGRKPKSRKKHG